MVKELGKQPEVKKQTASKKDKTVFVSGLNYNISDDQVLLFFKDCGEIQELKMPRYQDSGRSRGYCHITFAKARGVKLAIAKSGLQLMNRTVAVQPARGEKQLTAEKKTAPKDCKTIFIGNLPYDCTQDEIGLYLTEKCGPIANIRFVFNAVLKHFKGFGYVEFKHAAAAAKAMELNGAEWKGRALKVDAESGQARRGYHNFPIKNTKFGTS